MRIVNDAIRRALSDSKSRYDARGIEVEARLEATVELDTEAHPLAAALHAIFRALPNRLEPHTRLSIYTQDRAGGDIEIAWEGAGMRDPFADREGTARTLLGQGRHGDLFTLAVETIERLCGARTSYFEIIEPLADGGAELVRERVVALIPTRHHVDPEVATERFSGRSTSAAD